MGMSLAQSPFDARARYQAKKKRRKRTIEKMSNLRERWTVKIPRAHLGA